MTDKEIWGLVSVLCIVVSNGSYIRDIMKGNVKPHLFSWLVWGTVQGVIFAAQISKDAGAGAWVTAVCCVFCVIMTVLSIKRGEKTITLGDWLAFLGAMATIPVWLITHNPLWSVVLGSAIDGIAYYPTFRKSYRKPYEESCFLFGLGIFAWLADFMAFDVYSVTTLIYPALCIVANSLLITMIFWRRIKVKKEINHNARPN